MTQKQIRAMHRILARERKSKGVNEFHPSLDCTRATASTLFRMTT